LELNPGKLGAIVNKDNALQELKKYDEALTCFEKAYKINKGSTYLEANICYNYRIG